MNIYFLKCRVEKHPTRPEDRIVHFKVDSGKYHAVVVAKNFVGRNIVLIQLLNKNSKNSAVRLPFSSLMQGQAATSLYHGSVPNEGIRCVKV